MSPSTAALKSTFIGDTWVGKEFQGMSHHLQSPNCTDLRGWKRLACGSTVGDHTPQLQQHDQELESLAHLHTPTPNDTHSNLIFATPSFAPPVSPSDN